MYLSNVLDLVPAVQFREKKTMSWLMEQYVALRELALVDDWG